MANVNSLTSSNSYGNTYNLYGNRNVLTGLASGMDTEAMIQNSIAGYLTKISSLQQKQTMIQWKQDAFRNLIDQMNSIVQKYTSYTSKTNLASNGFFTNARKTEALGANASAVSVTGSSRSDIQINSIEQLASSARYAVDSSALAVNNSSEAVGGKIDMDAERKVGQVYGTMTLRYGNNQKIELTFDENDTDIDTIDGLKRTIEEKLSKVEITNKDNEKVTADTLIDVKVEGNKFTFVANNSDNSGDSLYISGLSGNVQKALGAQRASSSADENKYDYQSFTVPGEISDLVKTQTTAEYLSGKSVEVTLDGVKKTIKIGELGAGATVEDLAKDLQASIDKAFGGKKVTVGVADGGLRFDVKEGSGSKLSVSSSVGEMLGIGKTGVANYFNTSNTLGHLLGDDLKDYRIAVDKDEVTSKGSGDDVKYYDAAGKRVMEELDAEGNGTGNWYRVNDDGKYVYSLEINGKSVGEFTEDTALESVLTAINSDPDAGVRVSYSNLTGQFVFTASETGENGKIEFGEGLAKRLFTTDDEESFEYTEGKDAIVNATVNGKEIMLKRSTNVIDMDGLTVTLNKAFTADEGEEIKFRTSSDSDPVVDTIKSFVEDINKLMQDIHDAYATMPLTKNSSSSSRYEPLTEEDKASMNENAIAAYEEKAKTGILFGDTDLSMLYSSLLSAIQATGADRMDMEAIGLTTTYSNGVTTLSLDEDKLRAALDSDPEKVKNVFAKTIEGGASSNGLMSKVKATLNNYASTSLASPGILVSKAGTKLSALSLMNNNLQKEYDNIEREIESWQSRMGDKVDYYTRQFTQLEVLMNRMNNQSSMLAGLMGY